MTAPMLYDPARLARREDGTAWHPDLPEWPNDGEDGIGPLVEAQGYASATVWGEADGEAFSEEALEDGGDAYWAAMRAWQPTPPEGDSWLCAAIVDAEEGPIAWFVRPMTGDEFYAALAARHADDVAVDTFAAALKLKLADARARGRAGWEDKQQCSAEDLSEMLREHVDKGDPRDVAAFCCFLWNRGEAITATAVATAPAGCRTTEEQRTP